jgi:plastocyanin
MRFPRLITTLLCGVVVAACGGKSGSPNAPTPPTPTPPGGGGTGSAVSISMPMGATNLSTTAYVPNPVNVSVGSTVTWVNNDSDFHTASANNNVFDSGSMAPGARFSHTFAAAGSFPYRCVIHTNVVGVVNVQ